MAVYAAVPGLLPVEGLSGAFPVTDHVGSEVLKAGREKWSEYSFLCSVGSIE